jgi:hypothetical protein
MKKGESAVVKGFCDQCFVLIKGKLVHERAAKLRVFYDFAEVGPVVGGVWNPETCVKLVILIRPSAVTHDERCFEQWVFVRIDVAVGVVNMIVIELLF